MNDEPTIYQLFQTLIEVNNATALYKICTTQNESDRIAILIGAAMYEAQTREIMDSLTVEEVS